MLKNRLLTFLILLFVLTGCGTGTLTELSDTQETPTSSNQEESNVDVESNRTKAEVVRVVDGDTVQIEFNQKKETVRLLLVDTPETKHPDLPVQLLGPEASNYAEKMLSNKQIELEFDGPKRDKYDRLLAYIWVDGQNFNQLLLENGYARYAYEYDPPYTYQEQFKEAEKKARDQQIGIWEVENYVTDKGFSISYTSEDTIDSPSSNESNDTIYYNNCTEAHQAGVTPLHKGDAGYREQMDGDKDGVACET